MTSSAAAAAVCLTPCLLAWFFVYRFVCSRFHFSVVGLFFVCCLACSELVTDVPVLTPFVSDEQIPMMTTIMMMDDDGDDGDDNHEKMMQ